MFKLDTTGTETVLHSFTGLDGEFPQGGLVRDPAGNLYGPTQGGDRPCQPPYGCGTVFKVSPAGQEKVLYRFTGGTDGGFPFAGLVRDSAGNLYGTTQLGDLTCEAPYGCGVVFKLDTTGKETVLHPFSGGRTGEFRSRVWSGTRRATSTAPPSKAVILVRSPARLRNGVQDHTLITVADASYLSDRSGNDVIRYAGR